MSAVNLWWCRAGHTIRIPHGIEVTAAWCPKPGHVGTNEMKPRELFPTWGPDDPPNGEGRLCCHSYHDAPHMLGCRFFPKWGHTE